jgi:predicted lipid-binding transport protein (Tim44 family)
MLTTSPSILSALHNEAFLGSIRLAGLLDRAGGRSGRSSSSSSRSSGRSSFGGSSVGGSSSGGGFVGIIFLVVFGFIGWQIWKAVKGKSGAGVAGGIAAMVAAATAAAAVNASGNKAGNVEGGLEAIKAHDPDFEKTTFLADAEKSFFLVQKAWTDQDPDQSRSVMADGIWQTHKSQIGDQKTKGVRNVLEDLAIETTTIVEASSSGGKDTIALLIKAHCKDYEVDLVSGKRQSGDRSVEAWAEVWTYQRSSEAKTKAGGGTMSQKCPNCGAPLKVDLAGICKFCKANIMAGDQDWVLVRIDEASS